MGYGLVSFDGIHNGRRPTTIVLRWVLKSFSLVVAVADPWHMTRNLIQIVFSSRETFNLVTVVV